MAVYEYRGFGTDGKTVAGIIDAENPKTARVKLRKTGIFPTEVVEGGGSAGGSQSAVRGGGILAWGERVSVVDLSIATRQLATLLAAKLPLMEALAALIDQVEQRELKKVLSSVREAVREGSSLGTALSLHPRVFSDIYTNMVHAGEASGTLDGMLLRLADYLEYQVKLRNRLVATFTYPIFMLLIGGLILFGLVTFVVPKVTQIFEDMEQAIPLPTLILMRVSEFSGQYWWVFLIVVLGAAIAIQRYIATPQGRNQADHLTLRIPVLGRVSLLVALSRFTRTLSTLLTSGVPLLSALDVVKKVVHLAPLEDAIHRARENVREGQSLWGCGNCDSALYCNPTGS